jgi:hypothetical protein
MAEIIENHWETHQAVFHHKSEITKEDLLKVFTNITKSLLNEKPRKCSIQF